MLAMLVVGMGDGGVNNGDTAGTKCSVRTKKGVLRYAKAGDLQDLVTWVECRGREGAK